WQALSRLALPRLVWGGGGVLHPRLSYIIRRDSPCLPPILCPDGAASSRTFAFRRRRGARAIVPAGRTGRPQAFAIMAAAQQGGAGGVGRGAVGAVRDACRRQPGPPVSRIRRRPPHRFSAGPGSHPPLGRLSPPSVQDASVCL